MLHSKSRKSILSSSKPFMVQDLMDTLVSPDEINTIIQIVYNLFILPIPLRASVYLYPVKIHLTLDNSCL